HDGDLRAAGHLLQRHRLLDRTGHVRVVKFIRATDQLIGHQLQILAAKGMALARSEVGKGHLVGAADARVQVVDLGGKTVGRVPFDQGIRVEKGAINPIRRGLENAMEANGVWHAEVSFRWLLIGRVLSSRTGNAEFDSHDSKKLSMREKRLQAFTTGYSAGLAAASRWPLLLPAR